MKRIIIVTGDKGGTGKSTFSRILLDLLLKNKIAIAAYDCDRRNAQLHRHYKDVFPVERLDLSRRGGGDALLNALAENQSIQSVLIDLPAGGNELFEKFDQEVDLFSTLAELGYSLTLVSVISRVKDSINSLSSLIQFVGDRPADFVVVKNLFFGEPERFSRFDSSKTKGRLEEKGGKIISLPDLFDLTADQIDGSNLPFSKALEADSGLSFADRRRVAAFISGAEEQINSIADCFGLALLEKAGK